MSAELVGGWHGNAVPELQAYRQGGIILKQAGKSCAQLLQAASR
jgi:hypothetical protein